MPGIAPPDGLTPSLWDTLSPREVDVALLLARGESCREIAPALGISIKTADTHRHNVLKKLKCRNAVMVARLALREGRVTL